MQTPQQPDLLDHWAAVCEALGATPSKLEKRALLAAYLQSLAAPDTARAALFIAGQPFPEVDRRRLSVGGALLTRALLARSDAPPQTLTLAIRHQGDIGSAAYALLTSSPAPAAPQLSLGDLEELLAQLAAARGPAPRLRLVSQALARSSSLVCKYLLKLLSGDMRIGVKQSLVEEAIAVAYQRDLAGVRRASMLLGSLSEVVRLATEDNLGNAAMRLFHPLGFMLASPVDSVEEAIARFAQEIAAESSTATDSPSETAPLHEAYLEDKYDGMRAQLHAGDSAAPGQVGLFSRTREDLSHAFPELIEAFAPLTEPVILDGEILAWSPGALPMSSATSTDTVRSRALPFSSLQQRLGRKKVSAELRRTLPVVFMAFDILYADGQLWLDKPLSQRRTRLQKYVLQHALLANPSMRASAQSAQQLLFESDQPPTEMSLDASFPRLLLAPALRLLDATQLDAAYVEARARGNEGVMLKAAHSIYQPGRRGLAWLKLKRELATLDVVVTGAEFGSGRRAGYLSDYTFAVRAEDGALLNIGKAYSGLTDVEMHTLSRHFHEHTLEDHGHFRTVKPDTVLEVAFNNITRSSRHSSGYALRFPRILRIRTGEDSKPVDEIDTLARVSELYEQQPDKPIEETLLEQS